MQDAYAHCARLVQEGDKDRYLANLFAPATARPHLFALHAFNAEVAAVRERISGPMAGEIRLQWWRDAIAGNAAGGAEGNPVAAALDDTIVRNGLPRDRLVRLIEARSFDLYDDVMRSREAFDGYLQATAAALFEIAGLILGGKRGSVAQAAMPAGIAYGVTGLLRALPLHASRRQIFLPLDLLEEFGVRPETVLAGESSTALLAVLSHLRAKARTALDEARAHFAQLPQAVRPAFLPLAFVDGYLRPMGRADYDPFKTPVDVPQWRRQWTLWRAARRGG